MKIICTEEIEHLIACLAKKSPYFNQLIVYFTNRDRKCFDQCLEESFRVVRGKGQSSSVELKAAILFYLLNTKKPLPKGNRRFAVAVLLFFLAQNKRWLFLDSNDLYKFSDWIFCSPADAKGALVPYIEKFIAKHSMPYGD